MLRSRSIGAGDCNGSGKRKRDVHDEELRDLEKSEVVLRPSPGLQPQGAKAPGFASDARSVCFQVQSAFELVRSGPPARAGVLADLDRAGATQRVAADRGV